jgi:hypothetical protein
MTLLSLRVWVRYPRKRSKQWTQFVKCTSYLAIYHYLLEHYDKEYKFHFKDAKLESQLKSWLAWQVSEFGPAFSGALMWYRFMPQRLALPTTLYIGQLERTLDFLNASLANRTFLVGPNQGIYSAADMIIFPFVNQVGMCGIDPKLENWANVKKWHEGIWAREAVKAGCNTPLQNIWCNEVFLKRLEDDEKFIEWEKSLKTALDEARAG